jgi:hypothetical protein
MGVITNCCTRQSIIQSSSISVYSLTEEDAPKNNDPYKNELINISNSEDAFKFITSKDYYSLLLKKIPKHIISKTICFKLNNADIISLINKLFKWIRKEEFNDVDENSKKTINLIKENTKISLNYLLTEIQNIKYNEKLEIYILQGLTSISLIVQCLLFLANNKNTDMNEFKLNIWENKNIVEEAKKYGFHAAYFIYLIKNKYNGKNNELNENKITIEKKEQINNFYKASIDFMNDLINT